MAEAAKSAGANALLAMRFGVAAGSPAVAAEGTGANIALTRMLGIAASGCVVAAERLWRSFGTVVHTARAFPSVKSVTVIERPASRVIPRVVVIRVVVMPIATPVVPAPPVAPKKPDAEANSEEE